MFALPQFSSIHTFLVSAKFYHYDGYAPPTETHWRNSGKRSPKDALLMPVKHSSSSKHTCMYVITSARLLMISKYVHASRWLHTSCGCSALARTLPLYQDTTDPTCPPTCVNTLGSDPGIFHSLKIDLLCTLLNTYSRTWIPIVQYSTMLTAT